jgi:hypothetical protein
MSAMRTAQRLHQRQRNAGNDASGNFPKKASLHDNFTTMGDLAKDGSFAKEGNFTVVGNFAKGGQLRQAK